MTHAANRRQLVKLALVTVAVWLACVVALAYWYVVIGSEWTPVAAEYEQWKDYRLAFVAVTVLPAAVVLLALIMWLEWRLMMRKRRPRARLSGHGSSPPPR